jgi:beta-lactamase superfamily II metal-dependent hydrolase
MTIDDRLRQAAAALNEAVARRLEADQQPPPPSGPPAPVSDPAATAGSGSKTAPLVDLGRGSQLVPFATSGGWTAFKQWPQAGWPTADGQVFDSMEARLLAQEGQVVEDLGDGTLAVFGRDDAAKATPAVEIQQQLDPSQPPGMLDRRHAADPPSVGRAAGDLPPPDLTGSELARLFEELNVTNLSFPERGVVFWPVGTGDSTTVVVNDEQVLQVDLHDMASADEEDAVVVPVVDRLVEVLPTRDGEPYLAVFALTHADADHCLGFAELLDRVQIGELWATPRLWREYLEDEVELCEDAQAFQAEAERRVTATLAAVDRGAEPASGDRIRIIGYDVDRDTHPYAQLPDEYFTYPGETIALLDGEDMSAVFEAFVHAPFKDDCAAARNDTSLAMQLTLRDGDGEDVTAGHVLLFGDLGYATIRRIFDRTAPQRPERLAWDVLLAPHHCSKKVMYTTSPTGEEELHRDLLDDLEQHAGDGARIVASSRLIPASNQPGDNPPHAKAKARYEEIVADPLLCTAEYPSIEDPRPIVFGLVAGEGLVLVPIEDLEEDLSEGLAAAGQGDRATPLAPRSRARLLATLGLASAIGVGVALARRPGVSRPADVAREDASGLSRAQQAVQDARGTDAAPAVPVGFGRC